MTDSERLRVLVAKGPGLNDLVEALLETDPNIEVSKATTVAEVNSSLGDRKPDLLLLGLRYPDGNAASFLKPSEKYPVPPTALILTADPNTEPRRLMESYPSVIGVLKLPPRNNQELADFLFSGIARVRGGIRAGLQNG